MVGSNGSLIVLFGSHSEMTSRCSFAEVIFRFAEVHDHTFMWLKPMRKLLVSVSVMYFANSLSLGEFRVPLAILGSVRAF